MATEDRLDLLYCLTYCDAKAVAEGVLTGWEQAILSELHQAVTGQIQRQIGTIPQTSPRRTVMRFLERSGVSKEDAQQYVGNMKGSYVYQIMPEDAVTHYRLLQDVDADGIALHRETQNDMVRLFVAAPIRRGLLADLAGVIAGHNLSLKGAHCWQTQSGSDLFSYGLDAESSQRLQDDEFWQRVQHNFCKAIKQELDIAQHLAKRPKRWGSEGPADSGFDEVEVHVDQEISEVATVIDVRAKNRVGLMYHIGHSISGSGYLVQFAKGTTHGDIALDTCYVVTDNGSKLTDEEAADLTHHLESNEVAFRAESRELEKV